MLVLCNLRKEMKCRAAKRSCPSRLPALPTILLLMSSKFAHSHPQHKILSKMQTHRQHLHPKLHPRYLQRRLLPRRKYGHPIPGMLSYSPPRSSSAPPGALPASPVRASSASSSPVSSASTGPSTDVPDDASQPEGAPAYPFGDEATVITEARSLDEEAVVGFDAVPDVTDEELDRLLQEEEGEEGERSFLPPLE
ncbi:hypothetical protein MTO96_007475 [Rhipicephalus appendiculatus]